MKTRQSLLVASLSLIVASGSLAACTGTVDNPASGGTSSGGASSGGASSGGASSGGASSGGGGSASGGAATSGGASSGGSGSGGAPSGGAPAGGAPSGGSGSGGETSAYPATWETIESLVLGTLALDGCGTASCHNGEAMPHFTADDTLHDALLSGVAPECGPNMKLVVPGQPAQSAFLKAIKEGCGTIGKMPRNCGDNCYGADLISSVEQWIANGATGPAK